MLLIYRVERGLVWHKVAQM